MNLFSFVAEASRGLGRRRLCAQRELDVSAGDTTVVESWRHGPAVPESTQGRGFQDDIEGIDAGRVSFETVYEKLGMGVETFSMIDHHSEVDSIISVSKNTSSY